MIRIISRLDVKPPYVVKPIKFEGLRKIGLSVDLTKKYYYEGADEILYIDVVSSLYRRNPIFNQIPICSEDILIPFVYGGGISNVDQIQEIMKLGADKIVLNTHAILNPDLIKQASDILGSQSVVVHIEAKRNGNIWECYSDGGRIPSGKDAVSWSKEVEKLGAGEVMVSSVDTDGTKKGFDLELLREIRKQIKIPLIAASGAGSKEDILKVILEAKPNAVAISTILHYGTETINEIKKFLAQNGIEVSL